MSPQLPIQLPEGAFPQLTGANHAVTSPATSAYNCIAWAFGRDDARFWPSGPDGYAWPQDVSAPDALESIKNLFISVGYSECGDGSKEPEFEKIAIYINAEGPQHAARQLETGRWTSKLGSLHDIEHSLEAIQGGDYGYPKVFLKRPSRQ